MKVAEGYIEVSLKLDKLNEQIAGLRTRGMGVLDELTKAREVNVSAGKAGGEMTGLEAKSKSALRETGKRTEIDVKADKAKKEVDSLETHGKKAAENLKRYFGAAAFGAVLGVSTKAASDLNEAVNVTGLVFKESRQEIEKFVKGSAELVGMSETVARTTTANFGGFLKNLGFVDQESARLSISLTKLAADLGSAFNKDPVDAALALQSALRGEQEPIRAFNVSLNEAALKTKALALGLDVSGASLSANVRAQAALALITEQTSAVQGDFANTSNEAANATRIAQAKTENAAASLGQSFLPIYKEAVKVVSFLADGFSKLPQPIQLAVVALVGVIALIGPIKEAVAAAKAMQVAVAGMGVGMGAVLPIMLAVAAAAAVVVIALNKRGEKEREVAAAAQILTDATLETTKAIADSLPVIGDGSVSYELYAKRIDEATEANLKKKLSDKNQIDDLGRIGVTLGELSKLYGSNAERLAALEDIRRKAIVTGEVEIKANSGRKLSLEALNTITAEYIRTGKVSADTLQRFGVAGTSVIKGNQDLISSLTDVAAAAGKSDEQMLALAKAGDKTAEAWAITTGSIYALDKATQIRIQSDFASSDAAKKVAGATDDVGKAADGAAPKIEVIARKIKPMESAADAASRAAKDLKNAIDGVFGNALDFDAALSNYNEKLGLLGKNLKENGKSIDVTTEKGRENRKVVRETTQAAIDYALALQEQGETTETVQSTLSNYVVALRGQLTQLGLNEQEIDEYIRQLKLTPEDITTTVAVAGVETARTAAQTLLDSYNNIPDEKKTKVQALIDQGSFLAAKAMIAQITGDMTLIVRVRAGQDVLTQQTGEARAEGGRVTAGLTYTVGERGRERFRPDVNGTIDNAETTRMAEAVGGGVVDASVTVNGNVYGVDDLNAYMDDRDRKLARVLLAGRR